jgi:methyl-accepting chemotaxis protein
VKALSGIKLSIRMKLLGTAGILLLFMAAAGILAIVNLGSVNTTAQDMYANRAVPVAQLAKVEQALTDERRLLLRGFMDIGDATKQTADDASVVADEKIITDNMAAYRATVLEPTETQLLVEWDKNYPTYQSLREAARKLERAGNSAEASAAIDAARDSMTKAQDTSAQLRDYNERRAQEMAAQTQSTYNLSVALILGFLLAAAVIGLALALFLARGIVNGVKAVQATMTSISDKCATYLENGLAALAQNDLTVEVHAVTPPIEKYGSDEIGQTAAVTNNLLDHIKATVGSYETARTGLASTVSEVKTAADSVARTSSEVSAAATQSGNASGQIAATINQVASGASEQAQASSDTSNAVEELNAIISQVGAGASDITAKVEASSVALGDMAGAIKSASAASAEVSEVAGSAAQATDHGQKAVRETVSEMERIKATVEQASVKVTELGAKSDQIGAIVETIDDIAEQTNLLALNAAIEAARAGEQGKGFAVVADEVRKLAERSSRATKEIAALIAEVQTGTNEAVKAMTAGAAEVEHGSQLAAQAGDSLEAIDTAVSATKRAVDRITSAVASMNSASSGVVEASDAIATIAVQTNAAATRMTSAAGTVAGAVQSIAAISEENSAAAEQVSAATEEMSAQAEEVVASTESLAGLAANLEALVARFKIGSGEGALGARFDAFRKAHLGWVGRLDRMMVGGDTIAVSEAGSSHDCALGKWYYGVGQSVFGTSNSFRSIEAPHTRFHEAVLAAVKAHANGDGESAARAVGEARRRSGEVVTAIDALEASQATAAPTNVIDRRRASDWEAPAKARRSKVA